MNLADSHREQEDIAALLGNMQELASIGVVALYRGDTLSKLAADLAGKGANAKLPGGYLVVHQPEEQPESDTTMPAIPDRIHCVSAIELKNENRKIDPATGAVTFNCGYTADELKDLVLQRLHARHLGRAALMWSKTKSLSDGHGGFGYDLFFKIKGSLNGEKRAAVLLTTAAIAGSAATAATLVLEFAAGDGASVAITLDGATQHTGTYNPADMGSVNFPAFTAWTGVLDGTTYTYTATATGSGHSGSVVSAQDLIAGTFTDGTAAVPSGATVTLTGRGYAGEVFYYTLDGTPPVPGGATVLTYSAPFTAASGTLVRAAAIATGYALSDFSQALIP